MTMTRLVLIALLAGSVLAQDDQPPPTTVTERASYAIGHSMGSSLRSEGIDIDLALLIQGLRDGLAAEQVLTKEEMDSALLALQQQILQAEEDRAAQNRAAGQAFLAENAAREGVVTTESGLQYQVLAQGDGAIPEASNKVRVHYHGTLIDGTVFDSSVDRGAPFECAVTKVIKGWIEALQLMPVGSKYRLFVPSQLAYGDRAVGDKIGPGSVLIFEVELLEILE